MHYLDGSMKNVKQFVNVNEYVIILLLHAHAYDITDTLLSLMCVSDHSLYANYEVKSIIGSLSCCIFVIRDCVMSKTNNLFTVFIHLLIICSNVTIM